MEKIIVKSFSEGRNDYIDEIIKGIINDKKYNIQKRDKLGIIEKKTDQMLLKTYDFFKFIIDFNNILIDKKILIVDDDPELLLSRFISTYLVKVGSKHKITVYCMNDTNYNNNHINIEKNEFFYGNIDAKDYDVILARNSRTQVEDVIAVALEQDLLFFIESTFPSILERFESKTYRCDIYDDNNYELVLEDLHNYIISICDGNTDEVGYVSKESLYEKLEYLKKYSDIPVIYFYRNRIKNKGLKKQNTKILKFPC